MIARRVYYSGRVQGVGFRITSLKLSEGLKLEGYVKNISDGRVELLVQGEIDVVDTFLGRIQERMAHFIHSVEVSDLTPELQSEFHIER